MTDDMEFIKREDTIMWLHIVLSNKLDELNKISKRISELNHQIQYFNKMRDCFQNQVINDLNDDFIKMKFNKIIK